MNSLSDLKISPEDWARMRMKILKNTKRFKRRKRIKSILKLFLSCWIIERIVK